MSRYKIAYDLGKTHYEFTVWAYTLFEAKLKCSKGAKFITVSFME